MCSISANFFFCSVCASSLYHSSTFIEWTYYGWLFPFFYHILLCASLFMHFEYYNEKFDCVEHISTLFIYNLTRAKAFFYLRIYDSKLRKNDPPFFYSYLFFELRVWKHNAHMEIIIHTVVNVLLLTKKNTLASLVNAIIFFS